MSDLRLESEVVINAARKAAAYYHDNTFSCERKENAIGAYDIVTDSDIEAERIIIDTIKESFPEDSFLCEESGGWSSGGRIWVIDPIDGTVNYSRGMGAYGTQIALTEGDDTLVSAIYIPHGGMTIHAIEGEGAFINGKRIDIRERRPISECILAINDYSKRSVEFHRHHVMLTDILCEHVGRMRMFGCACFDFAMLASGYVDYHTRFLHHPWDHLPGMLIAKEAGAVYDEDLFKKRELLMLARSEENLEEITAIINKEMKW